ncbi:hypothetical protein [Aporhodopirellula aestuarii]|nr:hypothetical protein [Aporhodopirellula aestuarii]
MLIQINPRHRCPSCGVPRIAECYFAAIRIPIFGRKRPRYVCISCHTHIWYQAEQSIALLLVRICLFTLLLTWGLGIPSIASIQFGLYFVVCIIVGVLLTMIDVLRGTVKAKPSTLLQG